MTKLTATQRHYATNRIEEIHYAKWKAKCQEYFGSNNRTVFELSIDQLIEGLTDGTITKTPQYNGPLCSASVIISDVNPHKMAFEQKVADWTVGCNALLEKKTAIIDKLTLGDAPTALSLIDDFAAMA